MSRIFKHFSFFWHFLTFQTPTRCSIFSDLKNSRNLKKDASFRVSLVSRRPRAAAIPARVFIPFRRKRLVAQSKNHFAKNLNRRSLHRIDRKGAQRKRILAEHCFGRHFRQRRRARRRSVKLAAAGQQRDHSRGRHTRKSLCPFAHYSRQSS